MHLGANAKRQCMFVRACLKRNFDIVIIYILLMQKSFAMCKCMREFGIHINDNPFIDSYYSCLQLIIYNLIVPSLQVLTCAILTTYPLLLYRIKRMKYITFCSQAMKKYIFFLNLTAFGFEWLLCTIYAISILNYLVVVWYSPYVTG